MLSVMQPLFIVPFVREASRYAGISLVVKWDDVTFTTNGHITHREGMCRAIRALLTDTLLCAVLSGAEIIGTLAKTNRCSVDESSWNTLLEYASRAYAPASEESRALGAGAGSDDNG